MIGSQARPLMVALIVEGPGPTNCDSDSSSHVPMGAPPSTPRFVITPSISRLSIHSVAESYSSGGVGSGGPITTWCFTTSRTVKRPFSPAVFHDDQAVYGRGAVVYGDSVIKK